MSYDFSVYAVAPLAFDDLVRLVCSTAGFDVEGEPSSDADSLVVVRGARRAYCFTIDGPFDVEAEDVPEEVTASVIGAKAVYQVLVEGSEEMSIPHAVKFARKLAKASAGAVLDEQTDAVWPKAKGKRIAAPSADSAADRVDVDFYLLKADSPNDLALVLLRLARKYLPEALPRRFGDYEPLQGRLVRDGDLGFVVACVSSGSSGLSFAGSYPVTEGYYEMNSESSIGRISLYLDKAVLVDPKWRNALKEFFTAFAAESRSFYASVAVVRDFVLRRSAFVVTARTEQKSSCVIRGSWKGMRPYPEWWTWFGADYLELVSPYLLGHREMHGDHLFHSWSEAPLNRDQITALLPDPAQPWIPEEFQAGRGPDGLLSLPAKIVPPRLMLKPIQPERTA